MSYHKLILLGLGLLPALLSAQTRDPSVYGRAYLAEGDHAGAIENYQEATRVNPFDPVALNNLGVARAAAGDYQAALDLFARAIKLAPNRQDIAENHRQLQSWMDGQLRGGAVTSRNPFATETTPTAQLAPGLIAEPPALWQKISSKPQRNPVFQATDPESAMSFAPKKRKAKKRLKEVICAPKVAE